MSVWSNMTASERETRAAKRQVARAPEDEQLGFTAYLAWGGTVAEGEMFCFRLHVKRVVTSRQNFLAPMAKCQHVTLLDFIPL